MPFEETYEGLQKIIENMRNEAKEVVSKAKPRERKIVQANWDEEINEAENILIIAKEAVWLYSKFGDGEYKDIPGLCKVADRAEIEGKGWSLTPGAYVGVAPEEDDGVDFHERMGEILEELIALQNESNQLMESISKNMKEMGI